MPTCVLVLNAPSPGFEYQGTQTGPDDIQQSQRYTPSVLLELSKCVARSRSRAGTNWSWDERIDDSQRVGERPPRERSVHTKGRCLDSTFSMQRQARGRIYQGTISTRTKLNIDSLKGETGIGRVTESHKVLTGVQSMGFEYSDQYIFTLSWSSRLYYNLIQPYFAPVSCR